MLSATIDADADAQHIDESSPSVRIRNKHQAAWRAAVHQFNESLKKENRSVLMQYIQILAADDPDSELHRKAEAEIDVESIRADILTAFEDKIRPGQEVAELLEEGADELLEEEEGANTTVTWTMPPLFDTVAIPAMDGLSGVGGAFSDAAAAYDDFMHGGSTTFKPAAASAFCSNSCGSNSYWDHDKWCNCLREGDGFHSTYQGGIVGTTAQVLTDWCHCKWFEGEARNEYISATSGDYCYEPCRPAYIRRRNKPCNTVDCF